MLDVQLDARCSCGCSALVDNNASAVSQPTLRVMQQRQVAEKGAQRKCSCVILLLQALPQHPSGRNFELYCQPCTPLQEVASKACPAGHFIANVPTMAAMHAMQKDSSISMPDVWAHLRDVASASSSSRNTMAPCSWLAAWNSWAISFSLSP